MQEKRLAPIFAVLVVAGVVVPYTAFVPFLLEHGLDTTRIVEEITATRLGAFAWLDVLVSAVALLLAAFGTGWITTSRAVWVTLATCLAGVSAGLPLFFWFLVRSHRPDTDPETHSRRPVPDRRE